MTVIVLEKLLNFSNDMVLYLFPLAIAVSFKKKKKKAHDSLMTQYSLAYICTCNEPWGIHSESH